ncbi:tripartite tricarboxylate transporter TctB family protein [Pseudonocardia sp. HH130630-07]|uniref:tripartite tricarboxylate transporter TctB family protein n=1 Tax=Pseudonocardia sp. HH130630-07 TaxID=1690815 RepID=UPI000814FD00|nr:tripartite tricarboxylate transporter TctB family protein [Pseudonocardia sp. HH130630-07]ANY07002.1 hypothetical protein AFB00_12640 [Pseudonocardia sp. HH130630-07]
MTTTAAAPVTGTGLRSRLLAPKPVFLFVLLVLLAGYTERAFALDWTTVAGRIGPGYFPRILGVTALVVTVWALVAAIRSPQAEPETVDDESDAGAAELGRHPGLLTVTVFAAAALALTLVWLGAIVSSALFLIGILALVNPGRWITNSAVAVGLPLGLHLLFQTLLNAGLPSGILPAF